jgi:hypothetical protein
MKSKSESGLAHAALLILVLAVLSAVIYVGMRVAANQNTGEDSSAAPIASSKSVSSGTIKNSADLNTAAADLNSANVDSDLNPSSLDADLSSVL